MPGSAAYKAAWAAANTDKMQAYRRAWAERNREQIKAASKEYREKYPDRMKMFRKDWERRNPDKKRAYRRKNQTKRSRRCPKWADHKAIREIYAEAERLTKETSIMHEVDHIIPLNNPKVCGLHVHNNLQVLPHYVNRRKANKFEVE